MPKTNTQEAAPRGTESIGASRTNRRRQRKLRRGNRGIGAAAKRACLPPKTPRRAAAPAPHKNGHLLPAPRKRDCLGCAPNRPDARPMLRGKRAACHLQFASAHWGDRGRFIHTAHPVLVRLANSGQRVDRERPARSHPAIGLPTGQCARSRPSRSGAAGRQPINSCSHSSLDDAVPTNPPPTAPRLPPRRGWPLSPPA